MRGCGSLKGISNSYFAFSRPLRGGNTGSSRPPFSKDGPIERLRGEPIEADKLIELATFTPLAGSVNVCNRRKTEAVDLNMDFCKAPIWWGAAQWRRQI